ncbi:MAG TPA: agenet domain-containing protein [Flavobacterium sp.]|uniref:agenet domain-containing protein n=1 Tax=unclassified Flavobacterium TaxID=196869 RepID=UPI000E96F3B4|nr:MULTISPECIES: agenet domain-containing protein [unclassified Flavobacterium]HBI00640.1 hypothetical protein [Flavobacterium sp.]HRE78864.1 agenet domain-containing protein [Flavobacterium sp.]
MKKLFLLIVLLFGFNAVQAQKVNEKVQIESNGSWYEGKILEINDEEETYFVSYDGWGEISNEWVSKDRLKFKKATGKYKVGDRVEVEYGMIPEPATIIEVGENKYHIQYDKKAFKSKWVTEGQIKKL